MSHKRVLTNISIHPQLAKIVSEAQLKRLDFKRRADELQELSSELNRSIQIAGEKYHDDVVAELIRLGVLPVEKSDSIQYFVDIDADAIIEESTEDLHARYIVEAIKEYVADLSKERE